MSDDVTIDELMCVLMAREIKDGMWVNHGAVVPLAGAALMLAKQTHAPNLDFFYLGTVFNSVNPSENDLSKLMAEPELAYRSARALVSHQDILSFTSRGNCGLQFLRPIQIDRWGSVNVSLIGTPEHPRHRFHGIAVADAMVLVQQVCLYVTEHDPRVFPTELMYQTGTGHVDRDRWRTTVRAPGRGPTSVITPLCVIDFETPERTARVRSLHPGVTADEVRAATGFDIAVDDDVAESLPPSDEELRVLREVVDPLATRQLEFKETRAAANARIAAARGAG
jgi:glutaconate CoA-transferase subunit B